MGGNFDALQDLKTCKKTTALSQSLKGIE